MITHKQYPNHHIFETEIGGRTFTVETGKVAELCNAEAICRYGDTVVLVTAVASPLPKAGIDYFPLTIEVEERMYAVGRIPGSFNRREGKPSDRGVLISRLIDRPMRPLFDEELRNDVVLTNTILAQDYDNPVEIVASIGSSLVIAYSDIPWNGPTATTNVCYLDGKYIVNPSQDERNACQCFVTIASTHEKVVMIETEANEVKEDILMECIKLAHETNVKVVEFINTIVDAIGKPKFTFEKAAVNHEMLDDLCEYGLDKIAYALDTDDKNVREARSTEAVVGAQAIELLRKYHFTKGFFGTNGITKEEGFTTPDVGEAQVKQTAVQQCQKSYILADSTKFGNISAVTFAPFSGSVILTEETVDGYKENERLIVCR